MMKSLAKVLKIEDFEYDLSTRVKTIFLIVGPFF